MFSIFDDTYFMKKALAQAQKGFEEGEVPVGAVISVENRIIAQAHNLTEKIRDVTAHAEMQAITAASIFLNSKYLKDCILYCTLEPCVMCLGALFWSQIGTIVYGASDPKRGGFSKGIKAHPKTVIKKNVLATESEWLLKKFFEEKR